MCTNNSPEPKKKQHSSSFTQTHKMVFHNRPTTLSFNPTGGKRQKVSFLSDQLSCIVYGPAPYNDKLPAGCEGCINELYMGSQPTPLGKLDAHDKHLMFSIPNTA